MNWVDMIKNQPDDLLKSAMLFFLARTDEGEVMAMKVNKKVRSGQEFWSALGEVANGSEG